MEEIRVQCTVYSVQCTVYSVQCTVYSVQRKCTAYSVQERSDKEKPKYLLFRIRIFIFSIGQEAETSSANMQCLQYYTLPTVTRLLDIRGKQDATTEMNQYADLEDADKEDSGQGL